MIETNPYASVISLRSRRLRSVGIALIVVLLLMSLYGVFVVMPAMKSATTLYHAAIEKAESQKNVAPAESARTLRRVHRLMGVKLLFTDAYWVTCGLLAFAAMVIAWLDFREVTRRYQMARNAMLDESARTITASAAERSIEG